MDVVNDTMGRQLSPEKSLLIDMTVLLERLSEINNDMAHRLAAQARGAIIFGPYTIPDRQAGGDPVILPASESMLRDIEQSLEKKEAELPEAIKQSGVDAVMDETGRLYTIAEREAWLKQSRRMAWIEAYKAALWFVADGFWLVGSTSSGQFVSERDRCQSLSAAIDLAMDRHRNRPGSSAEDTIP